MIHFFSGGSIGIGITSYFNTTVLTLRHMLRLLSENQLRNLCDRLSNAIVDYAINVLGEVASYTRQLLTSLLERFGNYLQVQIIVVETITSFLTNIYGNPWTPIAA